jgi:hypothetical protein
MLLPIYLFPSKKGLNGRAYIGLQIKIRSLREGKRKNLRLSQWQERYQSLSITNKKVSQEKERACQ